MKNNIIAESKANAKIRAFTLLLVLSSNRSSARELSISNSIRELSDAGHPNKPPVRPNQTTETLAVHAMLTGIGAAGESPASMTLRLKPGAVPGMSERTFPACGRRIFPPWPERTPGLHGNLTGLQESLAPVVTFIGRDRPVRWPHRRGTASRT